MITMQTTVTSAARRSFVVALAGLVVAAGTFVSTPARAQALPEFADLAERVGPAVVNIRTTERRTARGSGMPEMDEDMLEFFRRFGLPIPNQPSPRGQRPQPDAEPQQRGVGSGFILSADGYVMTNAHVIDGADEVFVTLTDKREFKARVVGADRRSDVALVKIEASGLPPVRIGDVNRLRVGEWVIAIGSPFGLENTVTAGIVSAKARDTGEFLPLIQTDVAINPGNSGGPLINMRGEVVGINSQIYSRSGGYMGISFAIPIDEATRVAEQLKTTGRVSRGRIGVSIDQVTKDVAESIGLGKPTGALVRSVEAGGPAEKAGIEAGDIITRGREVGRPAAHRRRRQAGQQVHGAGVPAWRLQGSDRHRRRGRARPSAPHRRSRDEAAGGGGHAGHRRVRPQRGAEARAQVEERRACGGCRRRCGTRRRSRGRRDPVGGQHRDHQRQAIRVRRRQARQVARGHRAGAAWRYGELPDHPSAAALRVLGGPSGPRQRSGVRLPKRGFP